MINAASGIGWLWIAAVAIGVILLVGALFYGMRRTPRHAQHAPTPEASAPPAYAGGKLAGGEDSPAQLQLPGSTSPKKANRGRGSEPGRSQAGIRQTQRRSRRKPRR